MCVAIACETRFPSKKVLKMCEEKNSDGGGIAWVEDGVVKFRKGIGYRKIWKITKRINPPALIHFRIATAGGVTPLLCHPFPINGEATLDTEGEADTVLMHNGHWNDWRKTCLKLTVNRDLTFPKGPWSDSRAMAWLASSAGSTVLELLDEKIALLTGNKKLTLFGSYWSERDGIFYSNLFWEPVAYAYNRNGNTNYGLLRDASHEDAKTETPENRKVSNVIPLVTGVSTEEKTEAEKDDPIYMSDVMAELKEAKKGEDEDVFDELERREEDFRSGSSASQRSVFESNWPEGIDN